MTLSTVEATIRAAIGRGTALDSVITTKLKQAARWIERNDKYKYMEKFGTLTLNKDAAFPHVVDLPNARIRDIQMFRIVNTDGTYDYLSRIDAKDVTELNTDVPSGYTLVGNSKILLDCKPSDNFVCEILWHEFTDWPTAGSSTNWLLDNCEDILEAQTLILMSAYARDPKMIEAYKVIRDEGLHTLETSSDDAAESDRSDVMQYGLGTNA